MSYYDDKPKRKNDYNDAFQKSYPSYGQYGYEYEKERGGCLTAFLVLQFIVSGLIILGGCALFLGIKPQGYGYVRADALITAGFVALIAASIRIGVLVGVWKWHKPSYYILLALYGLSIVLNLFNGSMGSVILTGVEVLIFYYLVQDKLEYFD